MALQRWPGESWSSERGILLRSLGRSLSLTSGVSSKTTSSSSSTCSMQSFCVISFRGKVITPSLMSSGRDVMNSSGQLSASSRVIFFVALQHSRIFSASSASIRPSLTFSLCTCNRVKDRNGSRESSISRNSAGKMFVSIKDDILVSLCVLREGPAWLLSQSKNSSLFPNGFASISITNAFLSRSRLSCSVSSLAHSFRISERSLPLLTNSSCKVTRSASNFVSCSSKFLYEEYESVATLKAFFLAAR